MNLNLRVKLEALFWREGCFVT